MIPGEKVCLCLCLHREGMTFCFDRDTDLTEQVGQNIQKAMIQFRK